MFGRGIGPWEIGLILVIVLIFFGVGKLPQVGTALGKGLRAFRRGQSGEDGDEDDGEARVSTGTQQAVSRKKSANKGTT